MWTVDQMVDSGILYAGAAREVITPPRGTYLIGYAERWRGCTGVHDDLYATALALSDGKRTVALVACDLLCIHEDVVDRVRARVRPGVELLVCCSHTHAGPITYAGPRALPGRRACIESLAGAIARAVDDAVRAAGPAALSWSSAAIDIGVNRRETTPDGKTIIGWNRAGPVDRTAGILRVTRPGGEPVATVVNFGCHGTILPPENLLVSSEWPGVMRAVVERDLGGLALFVQGAAGDINPDYEWGDGDQWEAVQTLGGRAGAAIVDAVRTGAQTLEGVPVLMARRVAWLPIEEGAGAADGYRKRVLAFAGLPVWLSFATDALLAWRYPWRSLAASREGRMAVPLRVSTLRVGELSMTAFGAETFTEIGIAAKAAAPTPFAMFSGVTDGCIGYLPTAAAHDAGGYEVDEAPYLYRYPGRLVRECEALAIDAVQEMHRDLWE